MQSVTFYQITKIAVPPVVIAIEASIFGKHVTLQTSCAVALVCFGVALATITDPEVSNVLLSFKYPGVCNVLLYLEHPNVCKLLLYVEYPKEVCCWVLEHMIARCTSGS